MNHRTWLAGLVVFALGTGFAMAQTVYRTVDADGNVAYTDRPPAQQDTSTSVNVVDVQIQRTNLASVAARQSENRKQAGAEKAAADIRAGQEAEDAELAARNAQQREANCRIARSRLQQYSDARRLFRTLPNGEREYLDGPEIDAARAGAVRDVEELCQS